MHIYKSSTMIKLKDGFSGERALVLPQSIIQEMEKDALSSILHITDIGYYPALRVYNGKPLVISVNGKSRSASSSSFIV